MREWHSERNYTGPIISDAELNALYQGQTYEDSQVAAQADRWGLKPPRRAYTEVGKSTAALCEECA